jgi:benzoylformate decarboxylase
LSARADKDAVIFDEALTGAKYVSEYFPKSEAGEYFQTRGGSLGVGIPGGIGIKLAAPEKQVIVFTGDGGSMYTIQALYTAARYNIGAKFVILNNHSYQLLKDNLNRYREESPRGDARDFPDCFSLGSIVDYAALSISMGVGAVRVTDADSAAAAAARMLSDDKPFLVELPVEPGAS